MWQLPTGISPDNIIIYLRKSRSDDPLLSVEEVLGKHEHLLNDWVEKNLPGMGTVPEENRHREVVSGETIDSRPEMLELLRRIESPKVKAVLIVEPQRLSRGDLEDIGRLVKLLRYSNTIVITLQYTYDLRDERDRDLFERELKRGNEFLEYSKRIMNNGRLVSVQNGDFIGNTPPYGYRKLVVKEGRKKCHTLEPHPDEAPVVQLIFNLYKNGMGATRISNHLNDSGIRARGGGRWEKTVIRKMLSNEHYLGKVIWGKQAVVKRVEGGQVIEHRPVAEEYLVYPGKHEAIVDQETWDAVQAIRGKMPKNKNAANLTNVLAGLLFCECGRTLKYRRYRRGGVEVAAPRFECEMTRYCGNASCLASDVVVPLKQALREAVADFEVRIDSGHDDSLDIHRQLVERLERRLAELDALEVSQWEKYTLDGMPKHIFEQLNEKTLREKEEVQAALCIAKDSVPEPLDLEDKLATFRAALDLLDEPDAPVKELNMLLKACVERITYRRPKVENTLNKRYGTGAPVELEIKLRV